MLLPWHFTAKKTRKKSRCHLHLSLLKTRRLYRLYSKFSRATATNISLSKQYLMLRTNNRKLILILNLWTSKSFGVFFFHPGSWKDKNLSAPQMYFPLNRLSPNIHIQILQTDLHTSPLGISWENLIKDLAIFSMVIILLILITLSFDNVWILLGENWCWSLLGLKGLRNDKGN